MPTGCDCVGLRLRLIVVGINDGQVNSHGSVGHTLKRVRSAANCCNTTQLDTVLIQVRISQYKHDTAGCVGG